MRQLVLALALCFAVSPIVASAQTTTVKHKAKKVKAHKSKVKKSKVVHHTAN